MKNKIMLILTLLIAINFSGCVSRKVLLRKNKEVSFKPAEGGVIFSFKPKTTIFNPLTVNIQEVNQYKRYKKKPPQPVGFSGYYYDKTQGIYLYSLKLPEGTYNLSGFLGYLRGGQYYIAVNKIFDISEGKIIYIGRIGVDFSKAKRSYNNKVSIEDLYLEDLKLFKIKFPAIENIDILTDLVY